MGRRGSDGRCGGGTGGGRVTGRCVCVMGTVVVFATPVLSPIAILTQTTIRSPCSAGALTLTLTLTLALTLTQTAIRSPCSAGDLGSFAS